MALHDHSNVLVFLRWGIGDLLLQWPVLERLRRALAPGRLTLLGARPAVQLLEGCDLADRVRAYQEFGLGHLGAVSEPGIDRLDAWLDGGAFDAVADVLAAPRAVRRVAWREGTWRHYETDRVAMTSALEAGADAGAAIGAGATAGWGLPAPDVADGDGPAASPRLEPGERADATADRVLRDAGLGRGPGRDLVAVVPFASHPLKRWPEERFLELVARLRDSGSDVLVFAAPDDGAADRIVAASAGSGVCVVPPLHLQVTAALLRRARLSVGNDTGLLHLSAAVGTPAVGIFGPSHAQVYAPGGRSDLALQAELPCRHRQDRSLSSPGCWSSDRCLIRGGSCIEEVPLEAVLRQVDRALAARPDPYDGTRHSDGRVALH